MMVQTPDPLLELFGEAVRREPGVAREEFIAHQTLALRSGSKRMDVAESHEFFARQAQVIF
jgi:hypothetical protein